MPDIWINKYERKIMDKDYFLNHELIENDPILHFAFFGFQDKNKITQETINEINEELFNPAKINSAQT